MGDGGTPLGLRPRKHHSIDMSNACKPRCSSPTKRRMASRSTTSAAALSRPRCTAWSNSTPRPSSPRSKPPPEPICRSTRKDEFDAFLECGNLAHGFLRLRCGDCGHDKLVANSGKRRGF